MLKGDTRFGKIIDQSIMNQDCDSDYNFKSDSGRPYCEKAALETVEEVGRMGILEKTAQCRGNSQ